MNGRSEVSFHAPNTSSEPTLAPFLLSQACCCPFPITDFSSLCPLGKGVLPFSQDQSLAVGLGKRAMLPVEGCMFSSRNVAYILVIGFSTTSLTLSDGTESVTELGPTQQASEQTMFFPSSQFFHMLLLPQVFWGNPYSSLSLI